MPSRLAALALALLLLAAACGGEEAEEPTDGATDTTGAETEASPTDGDDAAEEGAATEEDEQAAGDAETIRVGAIYPLTGSAAATGENTLNGVRLAADIVNEEHPDIDLPLAAEAGLPNLASAHIEIVSADHEGSPERGASETERLITSENVVGIVGAYFSAVTGTASERAERLGIPFVNGSSSSTALTEGRDLDYFFRTGPSDRTFGETFFDFLDDVQSEQGVEIDAVDILYENTDYGTDAARVTQELAEERGYAVGESIAHGNDVNDVTPEATRICAGGAENPVFQASYTPEAILFTRTFKDLGCAPTILAYGAGYSDSSYFDAVGTDGEQVISRAAWGLDAVRDRPAAVAVAELFEERYGTPMDENSARTFSAAHALFVAINEAGSTEPDAIRDALANLELSGEETIMPWDGVEFDDTGQNIRARGIILQRLDGEYRQVWPFDTATAGLVFPAAPFEERGLR